MLFLETLHYIQEDSGTLPRAAIITLAGLGGIVGGYRGKPCDREQPITVHLTTQAPSHHSLLQSVLSHQAPSHRYLPLFSFFSTLS